jgi:heat shock protein HslJ
MRRGAALAAFAVVLGTAQASAESLTARGNEPSWRLDIRESDVTFALLGSAPVTAPITSRELADGHPRIVAGPLDVKIIQRLCADQMTGMPFPVGVEVSQGGQRFTGCGGEIMTAIEGGWRVIRLEGAPPPDDAIITVEFSRDGQVSGKSGCNRFFGDYTLSGEGLAFGPLAGTFMACPPPVMETEQRVLGLLKKITRVTPGENAQLVLMAGDTPAFTLDRAD